MGGPTEVTVGIDIGTTSVKAIAADGDGNVVARARVPHDLLTPAADRMEHDVDKAWRRGVQKALKEVSADLEVRGVDVAAMVPSLCGVNAQGRAVTAGLLYGDARGRTETHASPGESGELLQFLRALRKESPFAAGFWPAQGVANHALSGEGAIDSVTAMTAMPLFTGVEWDAEIAASAGITVDRLPRIVSGSDAVGRVGGADGPLLGGGTIDAFGEQLVAGADHDGDVLVILGTTLITWAVTSDWIEVPGLWTIPHTTPGKILLGGPSNAGGLFLNWATRFLGNDDRLLDDVPVDPWRVPVWTPYVRGERTPLHDPDRRAGLHDLDLTQGPAAARRAAYEAAGFVVRHHLDLAAAAGVAARRIVATGGGTHSIEWVQCLADATGLPVDVVAVPEGGALGAAFLARVTAGLEASSATSSRWARTGHRVEPDPAWAAPMAERYHRFRELTAFSRL